jgi:DNA-binding HxlR family transcriptional regulator
MPAKTDLSELNCSLARTLEVVGDWWTLLIIRDAFLGVHRFSDFQRSLGIAKNILATRLERLTACGIMARGGSDARPTYQLTERGRELMPALVALMQWGDKWVSANSPPVAVTDDRGRPVAPVRLRSSGGEVNAQSVRFRPGPGADARTRSFFRELEAARKSEPAPVRSR